MVCGPRARGRGRTGKQPAGQNCVPANRLSTDGWRYKQQHKQRSEYPTGVINGYVTTKNFGDGLWAASRWGGLAAALLLPSFLVQIAIAQNAAVQSDPSETTDQKVQRL